MDVDCWLSPLRHHLTVESNEQQQQQQQQQQENDNETQERIRDGWPPIRNEQPIR